MKGEMVGCFRKSLNMQGTYCCLSLICASEQGILYRKGGTETSAGKKPPVPRDQIPRFPFQIHIKRGAIAVSFKCDSSHSNLCYYGTKLHVLAREIGRADRDDSWDLLSYLYFTHMLFHFPLSPSVPGSRLALRAAVSLQTMGQLCILWFSAL